jgi:hypothetical protein
MHYNQCHRATAHLQLNVLLLLLLLLLYQNQAQKYTALNERKYGHYKHGKHYLKFSPQRKRIGEL